MNLFRRKNGADLNTRLAAARGRKAELELAEPALAHRAVDGDTEAEEKFRQNRSDIEAVLAEVRMLETAIAYEAEQAERKRNARIFAERERVKQQAILKGETRIELTEKFTSELKTAMKTYRQIQGATDELIAVVPLHHPADPGLGLYASEIRRFVADEIFRLDNLPILSGENEAIAFPQAKRFVLEEHANQPHLMTPLAERLRGALQEMARQMETRAVWPSPSTSKSNAETEHNAATAIAAAAFPHI